MNKDKSDNTEINVLLVDNVSYNLNLFKSLLDKHNYNIILSNSGNQTLKILNTLKNLALIILDINLKDINIFSLLEVIRSKAYLREVPIIFISTLEPEEAFIEEISKLKYVDILIKPVNIDILSMKVSFLTDLYSNNKILKQEVLELKETLSKNPT